MAFHSTDAAGFPVYHTNVMMAVGTDVAVVCLESVADPAERQHLLASLRRYHEVRHHHGSVSCALVDARGSRRPGINKRCRALAALPPGPPVSASFNVTVSVVVSVPKQGTDLHRLPPAGG